MAPVLRFVSSRLMLLMYHQSDLTYSSHVSLLGSPSAYSFPTYWEQYLNAVLRARAGGHRAVPLSEYGVFGSTGIGAGAFLCSPYAEVVQENNESVTVPDIQLTLFPAVSVVT